MKLNNSKYNTYAAYALLVIAFGLFYALLIFNLPAVFGVLGWLVRKLNCVLYAIFFAFLSISPIHFFERILMKYFFKTKRRLPLVRVLSVILAELVLLAVIFLFLFSIIPSFKTSIVELQNRLSPAIEKTKNWIETNVKDSENLLPFYTALTGALTEAFSPTADRSLSSLLTGYFSNIANQASAIFLGFVLSAYSLLFRRTITSLISKILVSRLPGKISKPLYTSVKRTYLYFMEYLSVRLVSAIYLALLSLVLCWIFNVPFRSLIAILVFLLDMIPRFGMVISTVALPLVTFILDRNAGLPLFLILLIIHVLHSIFVEPIFLRKRLRPNIGTTIVLSLIFGGLFGFFGFLFAVPIFASIQAIMENIEAKKLMGRSLPLNDEYYLKLDTLPEPVTEK